MTLKESQAALADAKANKLSKWTKTEASANYRINRLICVPGNLQSFTNQPSDSIFAIGSCFARNVEERLELAGAKVLSRNVEVSNIGAGSARFAGIFNKYNPASILQELQWASDEEEYPEAGFLSVSNGIFYDAHLRRSSGESDKASLGERREEIKHYFRQAFEADLVIITLGLTEAWYDHETRHYLNEPPTDPYAEIKSVRVRSNDLRILPTNFKKHSFAAYGSRQAKSPHDHYRISCTIE